MAIMANSQELTDDGVYTWNFPDPTFPFCLGVHESERYAYPLHTHRFTELVIILGGHGTHQLGEITYPLRAGEVFVVSERNVHAYCDTRNLRLMNILFHPSFLAPHDEALRELPGYHALFALEPYASQQRRSRSRLSLTPAQLMAATEMVHPMAEEFREQQPGYRTAIQTQLVNLIITLSRWYARTERPASLTLMQIGEAISRLERDFAEPITLSDLAEYTHMSVRTLVRRFHDATGQSPIDYLIHLRIRRAAELLRTTTASIADIATAVGFSDSNYFSRQYTRITGHTPREARRGDAGG